MAHWYVDSAATGTGSGDTPANAALNVTSISAALNVNSDVGAYIWVRRTNTYTPSDTRSMLIGINSLNVNSHAMTMIIGWPNSDDPFYDERPAAGVSAGWDSDVGAHMGWPSLVTSGTYSTTMLRRHTFMTNFCMVSNNQNAGGNLMSDFWSTAGNTNLGKLGFLGFPAFNYNRAIQHAVVCVSATAGTYIGFFSAARKITIVASTSHAATFTSGWASLRMTNNCEEIYNLSNSISCLFNFFNAQNASSAIRIGRVHGVRPYSADNTGDSPGGAYSPYMIDDYFGSPMMMWERLIGESYKVTSDGVAAHSGSTAFMTVVNSSGIHNISTGTHRMLNPHFQAARRNISVNSGVQCVLRFHFATIGVQCLDLFPGYCRFDTPIAGAPEKYLTTINSGIRAGSAGLWTGSLTGVSSYYMMYTQFMPAETKTITVGAIIPPQNDVSSGKSIFYSPFIEVNSL